MKSVVVISGGMDSTTLAYQLAQAGEAMSALSFDYGQRHKKEIDFARETCHALGVEHSVVDLTGITRLIAGSALTSASDVPDGHYTDLTMKQTVVPNRNAIMLAIAAGAAMNLGASHVSTAVHAGDHFIYPDCRPSFVDAMTAALREASVGMFDEFVGVHSPYVNMTKADIAAIGDNLGVPWSRTWSCYKGGAIHCGRCGTCVERREAFAVAGVNDPTEYEDTEFAWRVIDERAKVV